MKKNFYQILNKELERIDQAKVTKRNEFVIDQTLSATKVLANKEIFTLFNSNDYLGLRIDNRLIEAEEKAGRQFGVGPGAVRFISGSLNIYHQLEQKIADFHHREAGMIFSSAFAANLGVIFTLIKGQSRDSLVQDKVLVISDELNHRSIIDAIRLANLSGVQKQIFTHKNVESLSEILKKNVGQYDRVLVISDGIFSMLGEVQNLSGLKKVVDQYQSKYSNGVFLIVDDAHGVGAFGATGRGSEEVNDIHADVLLGTFGKAFGCDGGYVVTDKIIIDYLKESAATYIYSNCMSPTTAASALASLKIVDSFHGVKLLINLQKNITLFKQKIAKTKFKLAVDSNHPIQAILIGDSMKTKKIVSFLRKNKILATNINYPVVAKGKDEIRMQLSADHKEEDIDNLIVCLNKIC